MTGIDSEVWQGSRVATGLRRGVARSSVAKRARSLLNRARTLPTSVRDWSDDATVTKSLRTVEHAASRSGVARVVREGTDWARNSFLYRWLTAEPEPDVIVVDLRETLSIGPFLSVLGTVLGWLVPYWVQSTLKRLVDASVRSLERAADTRAGRALAALLAPPEPPDTERQRPRSPDERDDEDS